MTTVHFTHSPASGIGPEPGIMRRDPSDIIRVGDTYFVWYTKGAQEHGYDATIWYARSPDGHCWEELGEALERGEAGQWDEQSVFTPSILVADGAYWLYYTGVPKPFTNEGNEVTKSAIGVARAESPHGPWQRSPSNPVLTCSSDPSRFDSMRVDDACMLYREGRVWLYYKGRQWGKTPAETRLGVTVSDAPSGPFEKSPANPVVNGGHEVIAWPYRRGVVAMINIGPPGIARTLHYSDDGVAFRKIADLPGVPGAAGTYRPEAFTDSGIGEMPEWGLCIAKRDGTLPYLERFECDWGDVRP